MIMACKTLLNNRPSISGNGPTTTSPMKFKMSKILMLTLMVPCLFLGTGCGDTDSVDNSIAPSTRQAVKAREGGPDAAQIAELNVQLAAKLAIADKDEIASLLEDGATPQAKNRYGLPVLFIAAQRGDVGVIRLLIQAGADVNEKIGTSYNDDGVGYTGTVDGTPMSYAAGAGKVDAMDALRRAGADVNGTGPEGTSPLMRAAEAGHLDAVQWLIINGSTAGKKQALGLAQRIINPQENYQQIIRLLSR